MQHLAAGLRTFGGWLGTFEGGSYVRHAVFEGWGRCGIACKYSLGALGVLFDALCV